MKKDKELARELLNAVWEGNVEEVNKVLQEGASPNWIFNGYPILIHAVFMKNTNIVMALIEAGAEQKEEAFAFALDRGIGAMVKPLAFLGIVPKLDEVEERIGAYPSRYCPLDYTPRAH